MDRAEFFSALDANILPAESFFVVISLKQASEDFLTRMKRLLAHEWTHLLFFSQGIKFQTQSHPDAWLYDEGLATWIEYVYDTSQWDCQERLEKLHQFVLDRGDPRSATGYFEFGIWFNQHFNTIPLSDWPQALKQLAEKLPD